MGTHWGVIALLGALILFTFANSLHDTGFALDNKFIILEDPRLRDTTKDNFRAIVTQDYWFPKAVSGLYRPLTTLSYLFNYTTLGNGEHAAGYHWINFFLHWLNAALVYFVVLVLMEKVWPAALAALLFAVHPIVVESVTNIIGRGDLFAMASVLSGLLCYAKSATVRGLRRAPWLLIMMLITAVGVFCKENAVMIAPVVLLFDVTYRWRQRAANWFVSALRNAWEFTKGYLALVPPLFLMFYVRAHVFAKLRPPELPFVDNPIIDLSFWEARLTAIKVLGKYFFLMLWPAQLSCDYSYNQIPLVQLPLNSWEDWKEIIALVLVIGLIVLAVYNYRRQKAVFFFIGFFFLTLLPSSNLVPNPTFGQSIFDKVSWCIGSIMAERFLYMPSLGYAGCAVIFVYFLCRKIVGHLDVSEWAQRVWLQALARGTLCIVALAFGVRSFIRNYDWEDDIRLWTSAAQVCPDSFKSHKSLAYALYEKDPEGKNIDRIIEEGEKAVEITDRTQIVFLHLGAYYRIKGDLLAQRAPDGSLVPTKASMPFYWNSVETLRRAVPLDHAFNDDNRQKELRRGRKPEDIPDIGNHEIYWNLGLSLMRLGQYADAREAYRYMRHLAPTNPDAYISLATVAVAENKQEEAAIYLLQALLLDNSRQEVLRALINVYRQIDKDGNALIISPGLIQSQPRLNADSPLVRRHLCAAYTELVRTFVEAKQYELAQNTYQSALRSYNCAPETFAPILAAIPADRRIKQ
jgi:tetratricopeptide (TPR) repeat protein